MQRRSVCSALIEVLLLSCFFKRASVTPPFPRFSSYYSIIFLISLMIYVWTDVKSRQARNATAPKIFYANSKGDYSLVVWFKTHIPVTLKKPLGHSFLQTLAPPTRSNTNTKFGSHCTHLRLPLHCSQWGSRHPPAYENSIM